MSANSLSHLLHTTAGPEHQLPTVPESHYTIPAPHTPSAAPLQSQHVSSPHIASPYTSVPPPPPLPPTSVPRTHTPAQQSHPQDAAAASPHAAQTAAARSHSMTQSLYQCADCQRRYSRPEHLARHIQTQSVFPDAATNTHVELPLVL